jgi:NAD-dependent dihydropyrimidine dehydrogenase PreA subunit
MRGEQAVIDQALCYGCGLCAFTCPFDAIKPEPGAKTDG